MSDPAADTADRKGRREQLDVEVEAVQEQGRVELDVRLEPSSGLVLGKQTDGRGLDRACESIERHVAATCEHALGGGSEDVGPRGLTVNR